jgi:UDP-2,4-diacetamido-2,4,6-trideoxy-beta-L-altropyranose hydrolase
MADGHAGNSMPQVIAFRTDASLQIGTGHVMRCLTLADALAAKGADCQFLCREHDGNLIEFIRGKGYVTYALPMASVAPADPPKLSAAELTHSHWLGSTQAQDTEACVAILAAQRPDWLIVDHYALDFHWERALMPYCRKLMVIDDLADRHHIADVLVDQNMVEGMDTRYQGKVPERCICLLGPQYALLRQEFSRFRPASLGRRAMPKLECLLVFLGGSDSENETGKVIEGIRLSKKNWRHVDVVVGQSFPLFAVLRQAMANLPAATLHIQTSEMAKLMLEADLAITAGGSVTWEKCALGLPSLVAIQGDNQSPIAIKLHELGAQRTLGKGSELTAADYAQQLDAIQIHDLTTMTEAAQYLCDGTGVVTVLHNMGIAA